MAVFVVDLPAKFAGIKVGPTLLLRNRDDELEVILRCEKHPFQVVLTNEMDAKEPPRQASRPTEGEQEGKD